MKFTRYFVIPACLILLVVGVPTGVQAIPLYYIRGTVTDVLSRPLPDAEVTDGPQVTTTDSQGDYELGESDTGYFTLTASRGDAVSLSKSVDIPLPQDTVVDFELLYKIVGSSSSRYVSTASGPQTVTFDLRNYAPNPGSPGGADGTSCVYVKDLRTSTTSAADHDSTNSDGSSNWSFDLSLPEMSKQEQVTLEFWVQECSTGTKLTETASDWFVIDNTPPLIEPGTLVPLDGTNTIYSSQPLLVRTVDYGGSELDYSSIRFTLVDTTAGVTTTHSASYSSITRWAKTSAQTMTKGHLYWASVEVKDKAGNTSSASHSSTATGGGFLATAVTATASSATIPRTDCTITPTDDLATNLAVCSNVPLQFATSTVSVESSHHGFDVGYIDHTASLEGALIATEVSGSELSLAAYDATNPDWAPKVKPLRFLLPAKEELPQTLSVDSREVVISELTVKVPETWTSAYLRMPSVFTTASPAACADPSSASASLFCVSDPMNNRFYVSVNKPHGVVNTAQDIAQVHAVNINSAWEEEEGRFFEMNSPLSAAQSIAADDRIAVVVRGPSIENNILGDTSFRRSLHFNQDLSHTIGLYNDALSLPVPNRSYGALFTSEELAEVQARLSLVLDADEVDEYVAEIGVTSTFAGVYYSHAMGGKVVARFTQDVDVHRTALNSRVSHPERLVVDSAVNTLEMLQLTADRILDDLQSGYLESIGVSATGYSVDLPGNLVKVDVEEIKEDTQSLLDTRYNVNTTIPVVGGIIVYDVIETTSGNTFSTRRADLATPPVQGGIRITVPDGGCSAALAVNGSNAGAGYFLTAGHCVTSQGDKIYHHGKALGVVTGSPATGGNRDAAVIQLPDKSRTIPRSYRTFPLTTDITGVDSNDRVDAIKCTSGSTTGFQCGKLVSNNRGGLSPSGFYNNMRETDLTTTAKGDSGGAVVNLPVEAASEAAGVHSGKITSDNGELHQIYTFISSALIHNTTLRTYPSIDYGDVTGLAMALTSPSRGLWRVDDKGYVFSSGGYFFDLSTISGGARHHGDATFSAFPITSIEGTSSGNGYWIVAKDGGVFSFGDANFYGSRADAVDHDMIDLARQTQGDGYWLLATDGGVFTFCISSTHDCGGRFHGASANSGLNFVGMTTMPQGDGYWLVTDRGRVFPHCGNPNDGCAHRDFGEIDFELNKPIVGIESTSSGLGYWLVAADGGVFAFGDAKFYGSLGSTFVGYDIIGIVRARYSNGYYLASTRRDIYPFGDAVAEFAD